MMAPNADVADMRQGRSLREREWLLGRWFGRPYRSRSLGDRCANSRLRGKGRIERHERASFTFGHTAADQDVRNPICTTRRESRPNRFELYAKRPLSLDIIRI